MRRPRDIDAELKALEVRAKELKARRIVQLGELVIATGADVLAVEELAGALIAIAATTDATRRDAWRRRGEVFFTGRGQRPASGASGDAGADQAHPAGDQPAQGAGSAA